MTTFKNSYNVKPNQTLTVKLTDAKEKWVYDTIVNAKQSLLLQTSIAGCAASRKCISTILLYRALLPNYLSRQGPCIEVADINKDGLEDFFIGGAKDQPSQIFIQNSEWNI